MDKKRELESLQRVSLRITGQVQGVGFRPYVYRLATEASLAGFVLNDSAGVKIEVQGAAGVLEQFIGDLAQKLPPLARIDTLKQRRIDPVVGESDFKIRSSGGGELTDAQVTVDVATCDDCLREMNDPCDPRYRYPFINCTNCGPRYSIVRRIPYDRPNTTMCEFEMCPLCSGQYSDPASRRFHAQPVACQVCGPRVRLIDSTGREVLCEDPIARAASAIKDGKIVAIKGLGGFQLACRADDDHAVGRLRMRKGRDAKPFALMIADMEQVRRICDVTDEAAELLTGPIRPIVILPRRPDAPIAPAVAGGLDTLGVMLPYTPLHHLLFACDLPPCVMTSGNYSEEPLIKDNEDAVSHLGRIADMLLVHDRRIERSVDDSVVQLHSDGVLSVLRRARGYAPQPVRVGGGGKDGRSILAVGAELNNAVCLFRNGRAVLSQHIGDLKDGRAYRHFIIAIDHLQELFAIRPDVIAADAHPQYLSTQYALKRHGGQLAGRARIPIIRVQHHHAHIVSCLAENGSPGPAIGLACDGVGYGDDGAVWGCEVLRADLRAYERIGHLRYLPLPGGDAASAQTYRPGIAALYETFGPECREQIGASRLAATDEQIDSVLQMLAASVNCPPASSLGRWFDAVAALCGIAAANRYEAEAPMALEAAVETGVDAHYNYEICGTGAFEIDLRPTVEAIICDLKGGVAPGRIAAKFHNTVAAFLAEAARRARDATNLNIVALSGGCFANRYLTARLVAALHRDGFEVLRHRTIPPGDGGVALGQAVVAAARLGEFENLEAQPPR